MQKDDPERDRKHGRWRITDAKVNIAALLNDPRKARRDYDLFTKTWGEGFREAPIGSSIPEHYPLPRITWNHFSNYLGQTRDKFLRHQSQVLPSDQERNIGEIEESPRWQKDSSSNRYLQTSTTRSKAVQRQDDVIKAAARTALGNVPKIFLVPNFNLGDESTFLSVLNLDDRQNNHHHDRAIQISSSKLLQEKLSHYLDIVEVAIVRQISARSDAFFDEMVSQENLNEHLAKLSEQVHCMREKMAVTKTQMSHKLSNVLHLRSKLKNKEALLELLHIMASVHQAQPTIQLLLSTNEYSGAYDLIETTQQVLKQELAGIHCFRHLSSQLSEIEKVIGHMMKDELSRCIQSELQRPLHEGYATVNPNHLISIALGLLRRRQLVFLEEFHEGIKVSVKSAIKMTVMDAVTLVEGHTSESDTENQQNQVNGMETANSPQRVGTLADKMRQLEFQVWIEMLKNVFENMNIFLKRIKSFLTVIVASVQISSSPIKDTEIENDTKIYNTGSCSENGIASPANDLTIEPLNHIQDENGDVIDDMDQYEMRLMEAARSESVIHEDEITPTNVNRKVAPNISDTPVTIDEDASNATDSDQFLNKNEHDEMMLLVCQSLLRAADFSHDRCAKLIIAKNKNSSIDKLGPKEFLSYLQLVKKYISDTEVILFGIFEESNSFTNDEKYFSTYLKTNFGNAIESNSPLRGVLKSHKSLYIGRFHEERRNKLSLIIDNENWKQAEVPLEISNMFQEIFVMNSVNSVKSPNGDSTISSLTIDRIQFSVVGTVLLLFKMVADYIRCANDLPNSVPDLASRVSELLTFFNSRTCQLVLGAGALKTVGLKTISTKNLGLASRCLQLVLHLLPSLRYIFETMMESQAMNMLVKTHQKGLRCFDHVAKAYRDHVSEIDSKLVSILDSVVEACLSKWQVKAPMPSKEIRTICRQISKFHETICDLLPDQQIQKILLTTHQNFQNRLRMKLKQYDVKNDGGPKFGLVMSDVAFYQKAILSLGVLLEDDLTIESVWR